MTIECMWSMHSIVYRYFERNAMKRTGMRLTAVAAVTALLLGGCGEQPYSLTEDEEGVIVDYSAHAVAKFNTSQPDGLANVSRNEQETEAVDESQTTETEDEVTLNASGNAAAGEQTADGTTEQNETETSTLDELFGEENLTITYTGAEISTNYMEGSYYSLDAEQGKTYVIVGIDITNSGTEDITVDNFAKMPKFSVMVNGQEKADEENTILPSDFALYQETIPAGTTENTELLFQVPDSVTSVDSLDLFVNIGGTDYQITL